MVLIFAVVRHVSIVNIEIARISLIKVPGYFK